MSEELIQEINKFIGSEENSQDSKQLIDNFISHNEATVREINLFINLLQTFEDEEEREEEFQGLVIKWDETKNELLVFLKIYQHS